MRRKRKPAAKKKTVKRKAVKKTAAPKNKTKKKAGVVKRLEPKLSSEEVGSLLEQVRSAERSERAWLEMTSSDQDEPDAHAAEEEEALRRPLDRKSGLKTWKYFGK